MVTGASRVIRVAFAIALVLGALIVPSADAMKKPPIAWTMCTQTADQPGRTYLLDTGHTCIAGQNGITVTANNVTIDLGGFRLTGANTGTPVGVSVVSGVTGTHIKHGTIRKFFQGIAADVHTTGTVVSGINAIQNLAQGIDTGPGTVADSLVTDNGGIGLEMSGLSAGTAIVKRTQVSRNGSDGADLSFLSKGVVDHSSFDHNASRGLFFAANTSTVRRSTATGNATAGFELNGTTKNLIDHVVATANGGGIDVDNNGANPIVTGSSVLGNLAQGIRIDTSGGQATVTHNTVNGNLDDGILVNASLPATVDKNTANGNGWGVPDGGNYGINAPNGTGHNKAVGNDGEDQCVDDALC